MCEYHKWEQRNVTTRICLECGATNVDMSFVKGWISAEQAVHLGFGYRNAEYGLLELSSYQKKLPA